MNEVIFVLLIHNLNHLPDGYIKPKLKLEIVSIKSLYDQNFVGKPCLEMV